MRQQNVYLREEIQSEHDIAEMIGSSPAMQRVVADIRRVAPQETTVLITGETCVGKELVARAIHAAGRRAAQPMVKLNCAAIPEGMVESELFGHERGAFTSAVERRIGRFELANDGTLFLDEIGELPLSVQAKLLRVLQDGTFERVGGTKTLTSNARIIAATNRALLQEAQAGRFRRDLYYRLNVFPLHVPTLAERPADIPPLVQYFIGQFNRRMGKRIEQVDPACMQELVARRWPGNIRELRHVIERAMILCDGPVLLIAPETTDGSGRSAASTPGAAQSKPLGAMHGSASNAGLATAAASARAGRYPGDPGETEASGGNPGPTGQSGAERTGESGAPSALSTLDALQADHIRRVLAATNGIVDGPRGAAQILGLNPSTLRFRMKRLGIRVPRP